MDVLNGPCEVLSKLSHTWNGHSGILGFYFQHPKLHIAPGRFAWYLFVLFVYLVMTVSTVGKVLDDFLDTAFWFVSLGFLWQSLVKIYVFVYNYKNLYQLTQLFHEFYARSMKHPKRKAVLDEYLGYSMTAYTTMKYLYSICGSLMGLIPVIVGYFAKERILMFGIYFPYLDPKSSPGFELNIIYMTYLLYISIHGLTCTDSFFVVTIILSMGQLQMISGMQNELKELLKLKTLEKDHELEQKIHEHIKDIVVEHEYHLDMTRIFEAAFSKHSLVCVGSAAMTAVVCLVVLLEQLWIPGITMVATCFGQIFFVCIFGTAFESSCEAFEELTYLMDWYKLSPQHRGHWLMLLRTAAHPHVHTMGGVLQSNLNSFMMIVRTIYSILMMLLNLGT